MHKSIQQEDIFHHFLKGRSHTYDDYYIHKRPRICPALCKMSSVLWNVLGQILKILKKILQKTLKSQV